MDKDILPTIAASHKNTFLNFARFTIAQSGSLISTKSLAGYISYSDQKIVKQTLYNYLDKLVASYVITKVDRFDITGKKIFDYVQKYYAMDPCFITICKGGKESVGIGGNLETVIFNELLNREYNIYVGKTKKGEIDFVVEKDQKHCYIQVASYMETKEVKEREFNAYDEVRDNYPKYVISLDKDDYSHDGIIHFNAEDFLLGKSDLILF